MYCLPSSIAPIALVILFTVVQVKAVWYWVKNIAVLYCKNTSVLLNKYSDK